MHLHEGQSIADFETLYETYASSLYSITLTILPDHLMAATSLEAAFRKIWRDLNQFDARKMRLFTWMYQITRSTALSFSNTTPNNHIPTAELYPTQSERRISRLA